MIRIYKKEELYCETTLFCYVFFLTDRMTWFDTVGFQGTFGLAFISTIIKSLLFLILKNMNKSFD